MTRRTQTEIAQELEEKAARYRLEADRRLSIASDTGCELMWESEKALRALATYMGMDGGVEHRAAAETLRIYREDRWASIKSKRSE